MASHETDKTTFCDAAGRTWRLAITFGIARRLRDREGIDLIDVGKGGLFIQLAQEPFLALEALWALVEKQAESEGVTREQFEDALDGPQAERAIAALESAIVGFTHPSNRTRVNGVLRKVRKVEEQAAAAEVALIEDPEVERAIRDSIQKRTNQAKDQVVHSLANDTTPPDSTSGTLGTRSPLSLASTVATPTASDGSPSGPAPSEASDGTTPQA